MTLKDDERGDPVINEAALKTLNILKPDEYQAVTDPDCTCE